MLLSYTSVFFLYSQALAWNFSETRMATDYFEYRQIKFVCFLSCECQFHNKQIASDLIRRGVRIAIHKTFEDQHIDLRKALRQWNVPIGIIIDMKCSKSEKNLKSASKSKLFDDVHSWLVLFGRNSKNNLDNNKRFSFEDLRLSVNSDIIVATNQGSHYDFTDVFNFGQIQGNHLERNFFGKWSSEEGLQTKMEGFKYYHRWDFHNLTLRAISVVLGRPKEFSPSILTESQYTAGVSAMTKITAQVLDVIREQHNFRFNYTIADRWIGSPKPNSTLAVTNAMYWRQQDISVTCVRIYPQWLKWMDPFFPPATTLETKFYYLIPESGIGDFENRFLTPLSPSVWWCAVTAAIACGLLLAAAAVFERRPKPAYYALFSVIAAACQQAYEDGLQLVNGATSSQGRRLILLVLGLTSMILYNYYTSSVVSWLLNAATPTIATMDGLISSDLELTFEDIGYTRSWLDGPGFYYYSGFKWEKEDELREKKVKNAKRTVSLLQPVEDGIELVRNGRYAFHTEPYTAKQAIGPKFDDSELCKLGSLQMMPKSPVYIVGQKQSPYREFFVWSLMRALERGHIDAARRRVGNEGQIPVCSGKTPRALALGQAAPAFAILLLTMVVSLLVLVAEILFYRYQKKTERSKINTWKW